MAADNKPSIHAVNMTNFFTREMFMYSLGDIQFKKPVSLKKVAYTTGFMLIWSLPIVIIIGLQLNPIFLAITFVPPLVLGNLCVKPAFGGKTLIAFVRTMMVYLPESRGGWTDLNRNVAMGRDSYKIEQEIWISRRRELKLLAQMKEQEEAAKRANKASKNKIFGRNK